MSDPITYILLAAVTGGASGELAKVALQPAINWLQTKFQGHLAKAQENAALNTADFLLYLSKLLQLENRVDDLAQKLENPAFAASFQTACLASAETSDQGKKEILAQLVFQLLQADAEASEVVYLRHAIGVIPQVSAVQLALTGFLYRRELWKDLVFSEIKEIEGKFDVLFNDFFKKYLNYVSSATKSDFDYFFTLGILNIRTGLWGSGKDEFLLRPLIGLEQNQKLVDAVKEKYDLFLSEMTRLHIKISDLSPSGHLLGQMVDIQINFDSEIKQIPTKIQ